MDKITAIVIVMGIVGLVFVAFFAVFRNKGKGKIKGPFGIGVQVEGSNYPPRTTGVKVEDAKSRVGSLIAKDNTGRGAEVTKVEVHRDIRVTSSPPAEGAGPKAKPPTR